MTLSDPCRIQENIANLHRNCHLRVMNLFRVETSDSIMKRQKITFSREDQCGSFPIGIFVIDLDELSIIFHSSNFESNLFVIFELKIAGRLQGFV